MLGSVSYSQTSPTPTPQTARATLVSLCEKSRDEVILLRAKEADSAAALTASEKALTASEKAGSLSATELAYYRTETHQLRESLAKDRDALGLKEKEAREYEKALAAMTKSRNFYKFLTKSLVVVTTISVAIAATVILKE